MNHPKPPHLRRKLAFFKGLKRFFFAAGTLLPLGACLAQADDPNSTNATPPKPDISFASRAQSAFTAAKSRFESETNSTEAPWRFGRACFDWADFATTDDSRADIARQGIAACRKLIAKNPDSAFAHYYLAMDLGQLASARRGLEGLKIVGQMETEFKLALGLDPQLDFAGPDRNLGLLYYQTPGWPISVGNKTKARTHLLKALKLFPDYPENHINIIEACLKWGDRNGAIRELKVLNELLPDAREKLAGDEWAASWADWDKRLQEIEKKIGAPKITDAAAKKM